MKMTEQEHLECEIQEYQIELQRHEEAIERLKVRIEKKKKELLKKMKSFNINETVRFVSQSSVKNFIRNSGKIFGTLTVNWISFLMNHLKKMRMDTVNFKCGI